MFFERAILQSGKRIAQFLADLTARRGGVETAASRARLLATAGRDPVGKMAPLVPPAAIPLLPRFRDKTR